MAVQEGFTREEVGLAFRNHGMHLEGLRRPITPIGMHYLLVHFDIPAVDEATWSLVVDGRVSAPLRLTLDDLRAREAVTVPAVMQCAGAGRRRLAPRPASVPWAEEAVGCAEWTGAPLGPLLEEAGLLEEAVEVRFTALDRGIDQGVEHVYERSLPVEEARREDVLLAWAMNGEPLPPQHGHPLRLLVPDWYGMASVKWLSRITVLDEPFEGVQQSVAYRLRASEDEPGEPVTRKLPCALMAPPGIPEFLSRRRVVDAGRVRLEGRAWSGFGPVTAVEVSDDGGSSWTRATVGPATGRFGWHGWALDWRARPGEHELAVRATDATGRTQPLDADGQWNLGGYCVNAAQRVPVLVR